MVKIQVGFNKYAGIFSIILGGLALLGIFLPIGKIDIYGLLSIEITPLGKMTGIPIINNVSDLENLAGSIVLAPSIIGYMMLVLAIAISILGIIQLISTEAKSVVILIIIIGVVLVLITIIQFYIFKNYIKPEIPTFVFILNIFIAIILKLASAEAGVGFYLVLIPAIITIITSLIHLFSIRRESY